MSDVSDSENRPPTCPLCGCRGGEPVPPGPELLRRWLGEPIARRIGLYRLPPGLRLSVVMPVYNEKDTVAEIVRRVRAVPIPKEIILVDDGCTDGTREILAAIDARRRPARSSITSGTGARARRCGPASPRPPATSSSSRTPTWSTTRASTRCLIQPIVEGEADVVYGSRFTRRPAPRALLLALRGQPRADHAVEHVHRPEPDRHGDLLQGLPPRGDPGDPADARSRTASASSRK